MTNECDVSLSMSLSYSSISAIENLQFLDWEYEVVGPGQTHTFYWDVYWDRAYVFAKVEEGSWGFELPLAYDGGDKRAPVKVPITGDMCVTLKGNAPPNPEPSPSVDPSP